ncbi:MAG TPA: hypothetical protein VH678_30590, partial [Xanthobacteraceae bacterium]
ILADIANQLKELTLSFQELQNELKGKTQAQHIALASEPQSNETQSSDLRVKLQTIADAVERLGMGFAQTNPRSMASGPRHSPQRRQARFPLFAYPLTAWTRLQSRFRMLARQERAGAAARARWERRAAQRALGG